MKTTAFIQSMNFDMKDVDLFFDELKRSTDNGNAESMYKYAIKLENGIAVNKSEAACYYKMASDNGNKNTMNEYAAMLNKGDEIAVNKREAARYYKIVADNGSTDAMNELSCYVINW